jgi:hypothetical protein
METEFEFRTTLNDAVGEKTALRGIDPVVTDGETRSGSGPESRVLGSPTTTALSAGVADGSVSIARRFA